MRKKTIKASVTVFALIILGLTIGLYFMGYTSPMGDFVKQNVFTTDNSGQYTVNKTLDMGVVLGKIKNLLLSKQGLTMLGISVAFGFLSMFSPGLGYASGSLLSVMIPAFLLFLFSNIFFFPVMSEPGRHGFPQPLSFLLTIIFNVLLLLAILQFITGRE